MLFLFFQKNVGYIPDLNQLPMFVLRVATNVDWEEEESCFDTFSKELALFYRVHKVCTSHYNIKLAISIITILVRLWIFFNGHTTHSELKASLRRGFRQYLLSLSLVQNGPLTSSVGQES